MVRNDKQRAKAALRLKFKQWLSDISYNSEGGKFGQIGELTEHDIATLTRGKLQDVWMWACENIRSESEIEEMKNNLLLSETTQIPQETEYQRKIRKKEQLLDQLRKAEDVFRDKRQEFQHLEQSVAVQKHNYLNERRRDVICGAYIDQLEEYITELKACTEKIKSIAQQKPDTTILEELKNATNDFQPFEKQNAKETNLKVESLQSIGRIIHEKQRHHVNYFIESQRRLNECFVQMQRLGGSRQVDNIEVQHLLELDQQLASAKSALHIALQSQLDVSLEIQDLEAKRDGLEEKMALIQSFEEKNHQLESQIGIIAERNRNLLQTCIEEALDLQKQSDEIASAKVDMELSLLAQEMDAAVEQENEAVQQIDFDRFLNTCWSNQSKLLLKDIARCLGIPSYYNPSQILEVLEKESHEDWKSRVDETLTLLQTDSDHFKGLKAETERIVQKAQQVSDEMEKKITAETDCVMKTCAKLHAKDIPHLDRNFQEWQRVSKR